MSGSERSHVVKRLLAPVVLLILALAAPARADLFTLDSYTVTMNEIDPGLVLWGDALLGTPSQFELNTVGETFTTDLFEIGTGELALNLDDLYPYDITVDFAFSTPPPSFGGNSNGVTGAGWFFGDFGYVLWDNPLILNYGTSGQLGVSLGNVAFGLPGSSIVQATFALVQADGGSPASVPEPTTSLLLGVGALALELARRRRAVRD